MVRTYRLEFRVTRREGEQLREQADRIGVRNLSEFIRQRLFDQDLLILQQKLSELHDHLLGPPPDHRRGRSRRAA